MIWLMILVPVLAFFCGLLVRPKKEEVVERPKQYVLVNEYGEVYSEVHEPVDPALWVSFSTVAEARAFVTKELLSLGSDELEDGGSDLTSADWHLLPVDLSGVVAFSVEEIAQELLAPQEV